MTPFGERVRELRRERGISQKKMAEDIGVSAAYLSICATVCCCAHRPKAQINPRMPPFALPLFSHRIARGIVEHRKVPEGKLPPVEVPRPQQPAQIVVVGHGGTAAVAHTRRDARLVRPTQRGSTARAF